MAQAQTILFVDDEEIILEMARDVCESEAIGCHTARSGEEALAILGQEHIGIVVTDYNMPGMDGIELARAMRARQFEGPIFAFTGKTARLREALRDGEEESLFARILEKPLDYSRIISLCRSEMRRSSSRRLLRKLNPRRGAREATENDLDAGQPSVPIRVKVGRKEAGYPVQGIVLPPAYAKATGIAELEKQLRGKPIHDIDLAAFARGERGKRNPLLPQIATAIHQMQEVLNLQPNRSSTR